MSISAAEAAAKLLWRRHLRRDFGAWCEFILGQKGQTPAKHHRLLIRELQAVADGEIDRLMMFLPPGAGKSIYTSVLFPAWWLARGETSIIATSHTASLAEGFSRKVRELVREHRSIIGTDIVNEAVELWSTSATGQYRAAGVNGAIAGFRADLALADDLVKNREAADSETWREKAWQWYSDDLVTRLKPGAPMVIIGTRWHEDDIYGRLLETQPERWKVISIPAVADRSDDPLGRKLGEYLWGDDDYGYAADLEMKRAKATTRTWASLYQQQPRPAEGSIIKSAWWQPWVGQKPWSKPVATPDLTLISLDTAYTEKEQNDPSACTVWDIITGEDFRSKAVLQHAWSERLEFPALIEKLLKTAKTAKLKNVPLRVLIEPKASGLSVIQELRRRVPDLNIHAAPIKSDKVARANAVTDMFNEGIVFAAATQESEGAPKVFTPVSQMVIDEAAAFPAGKHDDLTDTVTMALRHMRDLGFELHAEDSPPPASFRKAAALY